MPGSRDVAQYLRGAACGLAAVSIWSGWIVVARLGLKSSLTPWDIAALRFGVAGFVLLPYLGGRGLAPDRRRWGGLGGVGGRRARPLPVGRGGPPAGPGPPSGGRVSRR